MKHIHKTQLSVIESKLKDLGIDSNIDVWQDMYVILCMVSAYMPFYDEDGDINDDYCTLYLSSDQCFHINTPYKEFDKLMNEYYENK